MIETQSTHTVLCSLPRFGLAGHEADTGSAVPISQYGCVTGQTRRCLAWSANERRFSEGGFPQWRSLPSPLIFFEHRQTVVVRSSLSPASLQQASNLENLLHPSQSRRNPQMVVYLDSRAVNTSDCVAVMSHVRGTLECTG